MFLRHIRWMGVAVAAVAVICSSPSRSRADIQVLIEELNGSTVVNSQISSGVPTATGVTFSFTGTQFAGNVSVSQNFSAGSLSATLTPSFNGTFTPSSSGTNDTLRIIATDDVFTSNGQSGQLQNQASSSGGLFGATEEVSTSSQILNAPLSVPASSTSALASGTVAAGPTATATADSSSNSNQTTLSVSGLPANYALQQTINVSFSQTGSTPVTFSAGGGADIVPNAAVPAPGGLALALVGLPLLAARRLLRKPV
jgi:hypothetical protein